MGEAPREIVASVAWENINGVRMKMGCVTAGTDGVPAPFNACHYVRGNISRSLLDALEDCLAQLDALGSAGSDKAEAAIARAKGETT